MNFSFTFLVDELIHFDELLLFFEFLVSDNSELHSIENQFDIFPILVFENTQDKQNLFDCFVFRFTYAEVLDLYKVLDNLVAVVLLF